jgi:xanthine dehydrogenase molybdenum-binding subunit
MGAEKIGWESRRKPGKVDGARKRGLGVACLVHRSGTLFGLPDYSTAFVNLNEDGTAHLFVGAADLGTGSCTTLAQIAAEEVRFKP